MMVVAKTKDLRVREGSTVKEFAELIKESPSDLIKKLMALGEMITINQPLSPEAISVLAEEFGYKAKIVAPEEEEYEGEEKDLEGRPPVVTIMGHVDHGKTLLLDAIRKTDVVSTEVGGITQHIGAYQIVYDNKKITFVDTPGHEAFTAMRARGAKITDIAVLVVAADDGVMPQTVEAVDHARAAQVPIIVAINKIDKKGANPDQVKRQLGEIDLVPEEWGGQTVFVSVSAKQRQNLEELLEMILLVAEINGFKATLHGPARGISIEAKLDKGRGPVATVLVQHGVLKVGDAIVSGQTYGKVRALLSDKGDPVSEATPSQPVEVLGFSAVPAAGDEVRVVASEKVAREIAEERALKRRLIERGAPRHISLDDLSERIKEGEIKELKLILKADVQGSIEALDGTLAKIPQNEVKLNILHKGVGGIAETDVMLAAASNAIVIGFNVRPETKAKEMATKEGVDMRMYNVIYKLVEDIEAARTGLLEPVIEEKELGEVEVRATFRIPKVGAIAGCYVKSGEITRDSKVRLVREGVVVYEGKVASLKRFKEDASKVASGYECGVGLENFQDIKVGDILETFIEIKVPPGKEK